MFDGTVVRVRYARGGCLPRHGVSECGVHIGEGDSGVREELPHELTDLAPALRLGRLTG